MDRAPEDNPLPVPAVAELAQALPPWHRDVARLDQKWADDAARVVGMLASSDQRMVQANAKGKDGAESALAYAALLAQMKELEQETMQRGKESWLDNIHRKFLGRRRPLVERMEKLMLDRQELITSTRQRIHGLREALDTRAQADEEAMVLLDALPALQEKAEQAQLQTTEELAGLSADEDFARFRETQLRHREAQRLPGILLGVRQQLQNAVLMGSPLRDAVDGFLHIEELNQTQFELSFGAHIGSLAALQGMQQSTINAQAAAGVLKHLPASAGKQPALPNVVPATFDEIVEKRRIKAEELEAEVKDYLVNKDLRVPPRNPFAVPSANSGTVPPPKRGRRI